MGLFRYVAIGEVHGHLRVKSYKYHKNDECPALSDSETIMLHGKMAEGFEPCGLCYDD